MRPDARRKAVLLVQFGKACQRCGYNRCSRALQFHHKEPADKVTDGSKGRVSLKAVIAHPERFELLCANCHFEEHDALESPRIVYSPCRYCGKPVRIEPRRQADGKGMYCSRKCTVADRPNVAKSAEERLWKYIQKTDTCWLWMGHTDRSGYGRINQNGIPVLVHRLSWELHFGPLPPSKRVKQTCGNPACIRPDHLA